MNVVSLLGALFVAAPVMLGAQQASSGSGLAMPPGFEVPKDMTTYYVAILVKGPKHITADTAERMELTKRHLSYVRKMIEHRKYVFAGPLLDGGDKQGLAIVAAPNVAQAKRIVDGDPAIVAGHMAIELHPALLPSLSSLVVKY